MTVAVAFLRWLDQRRVPLAAATQHLVDLWLLEGTSTRRVLGDFLAWAYGRVVTARLDVPHQQASEPDLSLGEDERWVLLRRCLHDHTMPLDVRAAGGLVLLYGLPVSRIVELTANDLHARGDDQVLRLGDHHTVLPPVLAAVIIRLTETASTTSIAGRAIAGTPWMLPGQLAGQPSSTARLVTKLNRHGIRVRQARNAALIALAADIPAAALSPLLGIGIETAVHWTHRAKRDWNAYIQQRAAT